MIPSWTDVVNRRVTTPLITGQSFCHTSAGMVSGPAAFKGEVENTALAISSVEIGGIES